MSASPFDFVKAVGERNDDPIATGELIMDDYNAFIVNRALSFRMDAIDAVQLVNENHSMPMRGQYLVLKALVRKRKPRQGEFWVKGKTNKDLDLIMRYTGFGRNKCEEILALITPDQLRYMAESLEDPKPQKEKK